MASKKKKKSNKQKNNSSNNLKNKNQVKQETKENKKVEENTKETKKKEELKTSEPQKKEESKATTSKKEAPETKEEKVVFKNNEKKKEKNENAKKEETKKVEKENKKTNLEKKEELKNEVIEKKEESKRKIVATLVLVIALLIVILVFSTIFAMIHSNTNTIAKGVKIRNIDVSGLTYTEAKQKLDEAFGTILDVDIELSYKDQYSYKIEPEDINLAYDFKKELDEAYKIGRSGNIIESNYLLIWTALVKKNINFEYKFDENLLDLIVNDISTSVPGLVNQYSYYIEENNLIINPGVDGIQVEKDELKKMILDDLKNREPLEIIKDFKTTQMEIPYKEVKADLIDMDKVYSEVKSEPTDAYYIPATDTEKAKIFADNDGIDFAISIDEAKEKLKEVSNEYIIPITRTKANVTINDIGLEAFPDKLQEFSTRYDASNWGRSENLRIATSKINGTVLMPGQQFSFNGVVGERTVQEGYKNAAIYSGDGVVDGLAGGICQISSTLYNAVLLANLQIDERYNHSFKTSYIEVGRDATVVYGIKDFKFTNTRNYPIKITGNAADGVVTFEIYGISEETEYEVRIVPEITATYPYTTSTVQDNSLASGVQSVLQVGTPGYKTNTYKETYLNGTMISREQISSDTYKAMTRIVHVGPTPAPTPAPAPTTPTVEGGIAYENGN